MCQYQSPNLWLGLCCVLRLLSKAYLMDWNMEELELRQTSQRVQHRGHTGGVGVNHLRVLEGLEGLEGLLERGAHDVNSQEQSRDQDRMLAGRSDYYTCQGADTAACEEAIRQVQVLD